MNQFHVHVPKIPWLDCTEKPVAGSVEQRERELFGHGYYWDGVSFTNVDPTAAKKKIGRLSAKQLKRRERLEKSRPVRGSGRRNGKGQVVHSRWRW